MTNVEKLFDFEKVKSTREGLELYVNFTKMVDSGKAAFSTWVLSVAKRFWNENPGKPSTAIKKFEAELEMEIKAIQESSQEKAAKKLSLTGNGGLAQAFKRIKTAVVLGADLNEFDTVSKLQAFVTERKNAETAQAERELAVNEIKMELEEEGLKPGTPEFDKALNDRTLTLIQGGKKGEKESSEEAQPASPKDRWDELCLGLAEELRSAAEELGEEEIERRFKGILTSLHNQLGQLRQKLLKSAG